LFQQASTIKLTKRVDLVQSEHIITISSSATCSRRYIISSRFDFQRDVLFCIFQSKSGDTDR